MVVFVLSYLTFGLIKAVFGLRVDDDDEREGLDIAEHGMYGYPEQFVTTDQDADGWFAGAAGER